MDLAPQFIGFLTAGWLDVIFGLFRQGEGFPNVIVTIDGTHVALIPPGPRTKLPSTFCQVISSKSKLAAQNCMSFLKKIVRVSTNTCMCSTLQSALEKLQSTTCTEEVLYVQVLVEIARRFYHWNAWNKPWMLFACPSKPQKVIVEAFRLSFEFPPKKAI